MLLTAQASNINVCKNVADHILLQDVTDCKKYISCMNEKPELHQCKEGLFFDVVEQGCTASRSGCMQCNKGDLAMLPLAKTCDKYVLCFDGALTVEQCFDNLQFNPKIGKCDFAKNVDCVENLCANKANSTSMTYVPSAVSCENYYVCMNGQPRALSCASGLYFSTKCNCCDSAENVSCSIKKSAEHSFDEEEHFEKDIKPVNHYKPIVVSESANIHCPQRGIFIYAHAIGNQYYLCLDGKGSVLACPEGRSFDNKLKACREMN